MTQNNTNNDDPLITNDKPLAERIERYRADISGRNFEIWHRNHENERNLEEGYGKSRNNPGGSGPDSSHSPSSLMQCHRKIYYRSKNAPREYALPYGTFIIGHFFEEQLVEPWLREHVLDHDEYIGNAGHVSYTEDTGDDTLLTFAGSHDPAITDVQGRTLALTEVKSTGSDPHFLQKVKKHHKAQAHAYMQGLVEEHDLDDHPPAFIIYVQKESLEVFPFFIEFDQDFWENEVVNWAKQNTGYRRADILPEGKPYMGQDDDHTKSQTFECDYCDYRNRCGAYNHRGDKHRYDDTIANSAQGTFHDQGVVGFLPQKKYPEDAVVGHLAAHDGVKLTPTLAAQHPEFAKNPSGRLRSRIQQRNEEQALKLKFGTVPKADVHDFHCPNCDSTFPFEEFDWWEGDVDDMPYCDHCQDTKGEYHSLRGPTPDEAGYND